MAIKFRKAQIGLFSLIADGTDSNINKSQGSSLTGFIDNISKTLLIKYRRRGYVTDVVQLSC